MQKILGSYYYTINENLFNLIMEFKKYINKMMMPCVAIAAVSICVLSCSDIGGSAAIGGGNNAPFYDNNLPLLTDNARLSHHPICAVSATYHIISHLRVLLLCGLTFASVHSNNISTALQQQFHLICLTQQGYALSWQKQ